MKLTNAQCSEIAQTVAGGCQSHYANDLLESHGLDEWDLDEVCGVVEQFKCPDCSWWGHEGEYLMNVNSNGEGVCDDCYEEEDEDEDD